MDGWMYGWMDCWVGKWRHELLGGWMSGHLYVCKDRWVGRGMDWSTDKCVCVDGLIDRWLGGWTCRCLCLYIRVCVCFLRGNGT